MITQVLIDKQRVQCRSIEAGQEHTHYNQQVHFLRLNPFSQVAVVILKTVAISAEIHFKGGVIVSDGRFQKLTGAWVHL